MAKFQIVGGSIAGVGEVYSESRMVKDSTPLTSTQSESDNSRADFVLVWSDENEENEENKEKRAVFLEKVNECLHVERGKEGEENYAKITAVDTEVLEQYAEILKLRMPLKPPVKNEGEGKDKGDDKKNEDEKEEGWLQWMLSLIYTGSKSSSGWEDKKEELTLPYTRGRKDLFRIDETKIFSSAVRSRIVEFILRRGFQLSDEEDTVDSVDKNQTDGNNDHSVENGKDINLPNTDTHQKQRVARKVNTDEAKELFAEDVNNGNEFLGLDTLLNMKVFEAAFPLHEEKMRRHLINEWGNLGKWRNTQPLDKIRDYYGEKVALYFAWLGFYNSMLIFPIIMGLCCFIYGLATVTDDVPSQEVCGSMANTQMCPLADGTCKTWDLGDVCHKVQSRYVFENGSSVFYAAFMALWSALFLEGWKRYSAGIRYKWGDVDPITPEAEYPRPQYLHRLAELEKSRKDLVRQFPKRPSFWRRRLPINIASWTGVLFLLIIAFIAYAAVVTYRTIVAVILPLEWMGRWVSAALINSLVIFVLNQLYDQMARWLTDREWQRTQTDYDNSLNLKIYLFRSINTYSSIFYVAFVKTAFSSQGPNTSHRLFGYRLEECAPGGCYTELVILMTTLFVGMQFKDSVGKFVLEWLKRQWKKRNLTTCYQKLCCCYCCKSTVPINGVLKEDACRKEWGEQVLFYEYLSMIHQFGFITVFACVFPVAPFFAMLNNGFDLRLTARRILTCYRRPVVQKVQNIGVWFGILETLNQLSIVINALVLGFTSEFIPKLVYHKFYNKDGQYGLSGFTNFSLSTFDLKDLKPTTNCSGSCRYPGYDNPDEAYSFSDTFFRLLCARLFFVICYILTISFLVATLRWLIPDIPQKLKWKMERERFKSTQLLQSNVTSEKKDNANEE